MFSGAVTNLVKVTVLIFIMGTMPVHAEPLDGVILYPVPLNTSTQTLTVEDRNRVYNGKSILVKLQVYDVNGDLLFDRNYNAFPIYWKGYSTSGKRASSGVYFIKLSVEELDSGTINKKIYRILIKK